jgi:serine/threonine protein kinase
MSCADLKPDNILMKPAESPTGIVCKLAVGSIEVHAVVQSAMFREQSWSQLSQVSGRCLAVCQIQDFGLSARLPGNATHLSYYSKGTPFYVAPEVSAKAALVC